MKKANLFAMVRRQVSLRLFVHGSFLFFLVLVTTFRNWIKDDPSAEYPAEANRYHIYAALSCPWVHMHNFFFSSV